MLSSIQQLKLYLGKADLVLFLGAGLSIGAGLSGWPTLIRPLAQSIGYRLPTDNELITTDHLLTTAQLYENQHGRNALIHHLRNALNTTGKQLTPVHRLVASLPVHVIFTTNYDDLIERALQEASKLFNIVVYEEELAYWSQGFVQVVKLCGDLTRPDSIVFTKHDFSTYFSTHPRLVERLRTTLESKTAFFLGYSLQDPFFNQVWDSIGLDFGAHRRIGYSLVFDASPLEVDDLQQRGIHVINLLTEHGMDRTQLLERCLRGITPATGRETDIQLMKEVADFKPWHPENGGAEIRDSKTTVLFLAADPTNASRLRLGEELREIQEKLQLAKLREQFELHQRVSIRPADISQALLDVQPRIVHFSGHGTATGVLCFENQLGSTHPIQSDALAALFEQFADQVNCVVLNACYSEIQANAIAKHIHYVIGMNQAIGDKAAIAFSVGFYQALGAGRTIEEAYKLGCVQIRLQGIPEHLTPVLIRKG